MALEESQNKFLEIMRDIKAKEDKFRFLKWIHLNWNIGDLEDDISSSEVLHSIATELRSLVPFDAILPSEKIKLPCGPNSDCESNTTVHVDEFLYSDGYLEELIEEGKMSRHYCGTCFSKNIKLLTFISHSMSISRIQYLFKCLLPPLEKETVLDIGSRLGPVLYGAYLYTNSPKIIGVEINADFCKLQNKIIDKYQFSDRIQVICNSIFNEIKVLSSADVIILNNVFEFFSDIDTVVASWNLLAQNIKVGCIIVTIPHLDVSFQHLKVDFHWRDWVEELKPYQQNYICDDETAQTHLENVKHYRVKEKINSNSKAE